MFPTQAKHSPPSPPMFRCECAGAPFREVLEVARRERIRSLELLCRRTGCGQLCTACRPDLGAALDAVWDPTRRPSATR